jgi:D-alanyl-D-alanine carboxypeptidase/D-alanyl-D-alanine-endopeptidase (penicillin-binding protein 4)
VKPHRRPRRTTVALTALSLLCGWFALRPEGSGAAVETTPRPVWTPERLPALLAEAQGTVDLERAVDQLLAQSDSRSCLAVYEGDRPVLLRRPDQALVPASTQKILLATAALAVLGPDFRFETKVLGDAPPRDGAVGTLWLVGSGDPALATPEYALWLKDRPRFQLREATPLASLAAGLLAAGVRTVTGGILGDDSRYDRTRIVPSWKATYVIDNEAGPLGALMVNGGFTVYQAPEQRAEDPAVHAAGELARLAGALGIGVGGPPAAGTPPEGAVTLATVRSAPLSDIVGAMLRESDNTAAELLVKELGVAKARDGSTPAGTRAVVDALTEARLPTVGLRLGDGSGLDVTNRATCALLAAALRVPSPTPGSVQLSALLAVAGRSGTLSLRLADTPLDGKLRAKTGSLDGVTGLAGYVDGRRALSFAFVANGNLSDSAGRLLQDRIVALLAAYPGPQPRL